MHYNGLIILYIIKFFIKNIIIIYINKVIYKQLYTNSINNIFVMLLIYICNII